MLEMLGALKEQDDGVEYVDGDCYKLTNKTNGNVFYGVYSGYGFWLAKANYSNSIHRKYAEETHTIERMVVDWE